MSFQDYLKQEYKSTLEELHDKVGIIALIQYAFEYEIFCYSNQIEPYWAD